MARYPVISSYYHYVLRSDSSLLCCSMYTVFSALLNINERTDYTHTIEIAFPLRWPLVDGVF